MNKQKVTTALGLLSLVLAVAVSTAACGTPVDGTDSLLQGNGQNLDASPGEGLYVSVLEDFLPPDVRDEWVSQYLTLPDVFCERLQNGTPYELSEAAVMKTFKDTGMSLSRSQELGLKLHYAGARWKCPELIPAGLFEEPK